MSLSLTFHGAAETVTGSRYLLETARARVLVDCGLFQGYKALRQRNREPPGFDPATIDAVVLTHAHLDHSGWLPRLRALGFRGPVYCTPATHALCRILLADAARLQEEDARHANEHGYSRHAPARPLFDRGDVQALLPQLRDTDFGRSTALPGGLRLTLHRAGHLLGAASAHLAAGDTSVLFSGDVGRPNDPIMPPPAAPPKADHVVLESTYGNRRHPPVDARAELAEVVRRTAARGGVIVIPSFAVGRAQALLLLLARLMKARRVPRLPVFLDSPMAIHATALYLVHRGEHRLSPAECTALRNVARLSRTPEQSRAIARHGGPMIVIAGSGMATGGRVLHHLARYAPDERNTVLLGGYQAGGTRGARLAAGAASLRIHGKDVPVRADVAQLSSLSAHADGDELLAWLRSGIARPRRVFVTHGEPDAADALRARLGHELGLEATVPRHGERFEL